MLTLSLRLPINGRINVSNSGRPLKQTPVEGQKSPRSPWGKNRDAALPKSSDNAPDPITHVARATAHLLRASHFVHTI